MKNNQYRILQKGDSFYPQKRIIPFIPIYCDFVNVSCSSLSVAKYWIECEINNNIVKIHEYKSK